MPPDVLTYLLMMILTVAVVTDTAHTVSPILMAWGHRRFRREVIRPHLGRYVVVPAVVFGAVVGVGVATSSGVTGYDLRQPHQLWRLTGLDNPFPVVNWIYWVWNIYHFGMQNFGVVRLVRLRLKIPGSRLLDQSVCLGATAAGMLLLPFWIGLALISFTHWLTELVLTTYVSSHRFWFLASVLMLGSAAFLWTVPPWQHDPYHGNLIYAIPALLGLRLGMGFVHFLYDGGLWKEPQVRATIGRTEPITTPSASFGVPIAVTN